MSLYLLILSIVCIFATGHSFGAWLDTKEWFYAYVSPFFAISGIVLALGAMVVTN